MKRMIYIWCVIAAMCMAACTEEDMTGGFSPDQQPSENGSIRLESSSFVCPAAGGECAVAFTRLDADGERPSLTLRCEAKWIEKLRTEKEEIRFDVAPNPDRTERKAEIAIDVQGDRHGLMLTVTQEGRTTTDDGSFAVKVETVESHAVRFAVTPKDTAMWYVCFCVDRHALLTEYANEEEVLSHLLNKLESDRENVLPEERRLEPYLHKGSLEGLTLGELMPGTDYVLLTLGVVDHERGYPRLEKVTGVLQTDFTTLPLPKDGSEAFRLEVDDTWAQVELNLTLADGEYYYYGCVAAEGDPTDNELLKDYLEAREERLIRGWSPNDFARRYGYSEREVSTTKVCRSGRRYCFYAFCIDERSVVCSPVSRLYFTAGPAKQSANSIHIEATDVDESSASVVFIPSNDDDYTYESYITSGVDGRLWEEMTDEEILTYMTRDPEELGHTNGWKSYGLFGLWSETEVHVFAFPYDGINVTGKLHRYKFRTLHGGEMPHSDNVITFKLNEVGSMTANVDMFTTTWDTYMYGMAPSETFVGMTDEEIIVWMKDEHNYEFYSRGDKSFKYKDLKPSTSYTMIAFCQHDNSPVSSPVFRFEFTTTP